MAMSDLRQCHPRVVGVNSCVTADNPFTIKHRCPVKRKVHLFQDGLNQWLSMLIGRSSIGMPIESFND